MNKTAIKNFAIWARNKLIADISYRAGLMGITAEGIHAALPQSTGQTAFYDIGTAEPYAITGEAIRQRRHLVELIQKKEKDTDYKTAYKYIIEEVAYTWFNRLIAVRFMEVNDYLPSHIRVLSSDTGKLEPDLVTTPFDAELEFTNAEQQTIIDLKNANKLDEVFRMLFIIWCMIYRKKTSMWSAVVRSKSSVGCISITTRNRKMRHLQKKVGLQRKRCLRSRNSSRRTGLFAIWWKTALDVCG